MKKFKLPKFVIVLFIIICLIAGLAYIASVKKAKKVTQTTEVTKTDDYKSKSEKEDLEKNSAFKTANNDTQYRGSNNSAMQIKDTTYTPVIDELKKCQELETANEKVVISLTNGVSPAIVASDIDNYRQRGMVYVPNGSVSLFVDKQLYGQTLAEVVVENGDSNIKNQQHIFFACVDPIELDKQIKINDKINIIASSLDMVVMDIHVNGKSYPNSLVIFGNYNNVEAPRSTTVDKTNDKDNN